MNECKKGNWGGGFYPSCKKHGGDYIYIYKNDLGGCSFRGGGILSVSRQVSVKLPRCAIILKYFLNEIVHFLTFLIFCSNLRMLILGSDCGT